MAYQSFDGVPTDSDSQGKLAALQLPRLKEKAFLDLGCNEGFFCGEALRREARRVVGIDAVPELVEKARTRFPGAEFRCGSWWDLPDETFDVILMASALHYERNPLDLARKIRSHLAPGGVFVLECGVVPEWVNPVWIEVQRWDCAPRYPSLALLRDHILQDFAVRHIGKSVDPPGDPVARHVFHCHAYQPIVLMVGGASGSGKTVLATELGKRGLPIVDIDQIVLEVAKHTSGHAGGVFDVIRAGYHPHLQGALYERIAADDALRTQLARHVSEFLPEYARTTILEGAILGDPRFLAAVRVFAENRGFRVWVVQRPEEARELPAVDLAVGADVRCLGHLDAAFVVGGGTTEYVVAGWCMKPGLPTAYGVVLDVDGARYGPYLADTFRPDLKAAGIGSGAHGFAIPLGPVPHTEQSIVRAFSADGTELSGGGCSLAALVARRAGR